MIESDQHPDSNQRPESDQCPDSNQHPESDQHPDSNQHPESDQRPDSNQLTSLSQITVQYKGILKSPSFPNSQINGRFIGQG